MNLTIIGAGNIGGATAKGIHAASPDIRITVTAKHQKTLDKFEGSGIKTSLDNVSSVKEADVVIIAVKPWLVENVLTEIRDNLDYDRQLIISLAAGIEGEQFAKWLDKNGRTPSIVYAMPNTAIGICQSMTFISAVKADEASIKTAVELFKGTGSVRVINLKLFPAAMALASCGIAYAMRYIRAAAEGGVELGFYPEDAVSIVCQTVMGAASLISTNGTNPEVEIDKVTTPGGITIKGLNAMEKEGFTNAVISGLKASTK